LFLTLQVLRTILTGPVIVPLLYENAINAIDDADECKNKKKSNSKVSNKQKRALNEITDFLNSDPASNVQLKKRNPVLDDEESLPEDPISIKSGTKAAPKKKGGKKGATTSPDSDEEESLLEDPIKKGAKAAPKKKGGKKGTAAPQKKGGQAKVKPFTTAKVHAPATEKKLNYRGNQKRGVGRPKGSTTTTAAKKKGADPPMVNDDCNTSNVSASDREHLEEQKKVLQAIQKATVEQKRLSEEMERNSRALRRREGIYIVLILQII